MTHPPTYHAQIRRDIYRQFMGTMTREAKSIHVIAHEMGTVSTAIESAIRSEMNRIRRMKWKR
jgi:hypothetical protein